MFSSYQYVMKSFEDEDGKTIITNNDSAKPFCIKSL